MGMPFYRPAALLTMAAEPAIIRDGESEPGRAIENNPTGGPMTTTTYYPATTGVPTGNARKAARSPMVLLIVETRFRQARVRVSRRDAETQRQFATRLAGAARLVRLQRTKR